MILHQTVKRAVVEEEVARKPSISQRRDLIRATMILWKRMRKKVSMSKMNRMRTRRARANRFIIDRTQRTTITLWRAAYLPLCCRQLELVMSPLKPFRIQKWRSPSSLPLPSLGQTAKRRYKIWHFWKTRCAPFKINRYYNYS